MQAIDFGLSFGYDAFELIARGAVGRPFDFELQGQAVDLRLSLRNDVSEFFFEFANFALSVRFLADACDFGLFKDAGCGEKVASSAFEARDQSAKAKGDDGIGEGATAHVFFAAFLMASSVAS